MGCGCSKKNRVQYQVTVVASGEKLPLQPDAVSAHKAGQAKTGSSSGYTVRPVPA